jgi:hypothetical protein
MAIRCFFLMAACLSWLGCRAVSPSNPEGPAPSAGAPSTSGAQVPSSAGRTVVYVYYFHQTFRCLSCQSMEEAAGRVIQEHFAQPLQVGRVVWMPVNIDKPEGKVLQQEFQVRASELVLARLEEGVCKESQKLEELSGLMDRPDAFSKYLIDGVSACLAAAGGG